MSAPGEDAAAVALPPHSRPRDQLPRPPHFQKCRPSRSHRESSSQFESRDVLTVENTLPVVEVKEFSNGFDASPELVLGVPAAGEAKVSTSGSFTGSEGEVAHNRIIVTRYPAEYNSALNDISTATGTCLSAKQFPHDLDVNDINTIDSSSDRCVGAVSNNALYIDGAAPLHMSLPPPVPPPPPDAVAPSSSGAGNTATAADDFVKPIHASQYQETLSSSRCAMHRHDMQQLPPSHELQHDLCPSSAGDEGDHDDTCNDGSAINSNPSEGTGRPDCCSVSCTARLDGAALCVSSDHCCDGRHCDDGNNQHLDCKSSDHFCVDTANSSSNYLQHLHNNCEDQAGSHSGSMGNVQSSRFSDQLPPASLSIEESAVPSTEDISEVEDSRQLAGDIVSVASHTNLYINPIGNLPATFDREKLFNLQKVEAELDSPIHIKIKESLSIMAHESTDATDEEKLCKLYRDNEAGKTNSALNVLPERVIFATRVKLEPLCWIKNNSLNEIETIAVNDKVDQFAGALAKDLVGEAVLLSSTQAWNIRCSGQCRREQCRQEYYQSLLTSGKLVDSYYPTSNDFIKGKTPLSSTFASTATLGAPGGYYNSSTLSSSSACAGGRSSSSSAGSSAVWHNTNTIAAADRSSSGSGGATRLMMTGTGVLSSGGSPGLCWTPELSADGNSPTEEFPEMYNNKGTFSPPLSIEKHSAYEYQKNMSTNTTCSLTASRGRIKQPNKVDQRQDISSSSISESPPVESSSSKPDANSASSSMRPSLLSPTLMMKPSSLGSPLSVSHESIVCREVLDDSHLISSAISHDALLYSGPDTAKSSEPLLKHSDDPNDGESELVCSIPLSKDQKHFNRLNNGVPNSRTPRERSSHNKRKRRIKRKRSTSSRMRNSKSFSSQQRGGITENRALNRVLFRKQRSDGVADVYSVPIDTLEEPGIVNPKAVIASQPRALSMITDDKCYDKNNTSTHRKHRVASSNITAGLPFLNASSIVIGSTNSVLHNIRKIATNNNNEEEDCVFKKTDDFKFVSNKSLTKDPKKKLKPTKSGRILTSSVELSSPSSRQSIVSTIGGHASTTCVVASPRVRRSLLDGKQSVASDPIHMTLGDVQNVFHGSNNTINLDKVPNHRSSNSRVSRKERHENHRICKILPFTALKSCKRKDHSSESRDEVYMAADAPLVATNKASSSDRRRGPSLFSNIRSSLLSLFSFGGSSDRSASKEQLKPETKGSPSLRASNSVEIESHADSTSESACNTDAACDGAVATAVVSADTVKVVLETQNSVDLLNHSNYSAFTSVINAVVARPGNGDCLGNDSEHMILPEVHANDPIDKGALESVVALNNHLPPLDPSIGIDSSASASIVPTAPVTPRSPVSVGNRALPPLPAPEGSQGHDEPTEVVSSAQQQPPPAVAAAPLHPLPLVEEVIEENHKKEEGCHFASMIQKVKDYGWYWGPISSKAAEKIVSNEPDGSFIVRDSSDDHYIFSLTFRLNGFTRHVRIEHDQGNFSFGGFTKFKSQTIVEFIESAVEHSRSGRYLFFLHRRPVLGPMRVQLLHPVSRYRHIQSLQHLCRFVIVKCVRRDLLGSLGLPVRLRDYLASPHYYSERVDQCIREEMEEDIHAAAQQRDSGTVSRLRQVEDNASAAAAAAEDHHSLATEQPSREANGDTESHDTVGTVAEAREHVSSNEAEDNDQNVHPSVIEAPSAPNVPFVNADIPAVISSSKSVSNQLPIIGFFQQETNLISGNDFLDNDNVRRSNKDKTMMSESSKCTSNASEALCPVNCNESFKSPLSLSTYINAAPTKPCTRLRTCKLVSYRVDLEAANLTVTKVTKVVNDDSDAAVVVSETKHESAEIDCYKLKGKVNNTAECAEADVCDSVTKVSCPPSICVASQLDACQITESLQKHVYMNDKLDKDSTCNLNELKAQILIPYSVNIMPPTINTTVTLISHNVSLSNSSTSKCLATCISPVPIVSLPEPDDVTKLSCFNTTQINSITTDPIDNKLCNYNSRCTACNSDRFSSIELDASTTVAETSVIDAASSCGRCCSCASNKSSSAVATCDTFDSPDAARCDISGAVAATSLSDAISASAVAAHHTAANTAPTPSSVIFNASLQELGTF